MFSGSQRLSSHSFAKRFSITGSFRDKNSDHFFIMHWFSIVYCYRITYIYFIIPQKKDEEAPLLLPSESTATAASTPSVTIPDVFASWPTDIVRSPAVNGLELSCLSASSRDYGWQYNVFRVSTVRRPVYTWSCICVLCAAELPSNATREQLDKHLNKCPTYNYYNIRLGFDPSMSNASPRPTPRRK